MVDIAGIWFTAAQKAELVGAMEERAKCCGGSRGGRLERKNKDRR